MTCEKSLDKPMIYNNVNTISMCTKYFFLEYFMQPINIWMAKRDFQSIAFVDLNVTLFICTTYKFV